MCGDEEDQISDTIQDTRLFFVKIENWKTKILTNMFNFCEREK